MEINTGWRFLSWLLVGSVGTNIRLTSTGVSLTMGASLPGYQNSYKFHFEVTYRRFPFYPLRATTWGLFGGYLCSRDSVVNFP